MRSREKAARRENEALLNAFRELGLDPLQLWVPVHDLELANRQLAKLLRWACAYRQCPNRKQLERDGFDCPPVEPDLSPDNDWFLFERWMRGQPLRWSLRGEWTGRKQPEDMDDREVAVAVEGILGRLAVRGVRLELCEGIPPRVVYQYVLNTLLDREFEHTLPGIVTHLTECDGCCPGCFQQPWCGRSDHRQRAGDRQNGRTDRPDGG